MSIEQGTKLIQLGIDSGDPELIQMGKQMVKDWSIDPKPKIATLQPVLPSAEPEPVPNTHICAECSEYSWHENPRKKKCPHCGKLKLKPIETDNSQAEFDSITEAVEDIEEEEDDEPVDFMDQFKMPEGNKKPQKATLDDGTEVTFTRKEQIQPFKNTWTDDMTEELQDLDLNKKLGNNKKHTSARAGVKYSSFVCDNCNKKVKQRVPKGSMGECEKCVISKAKRLIGG